MARASWLLIAFALGGCGREDIELAPGRSTDGAKCSSPIVPDPLESQRVGCKFAAGALARDTLALSDVERQKIPIEHIVVMIKENRSFDHFLGQLSTEGQPGTEGIPATYAALGGRPAHASTTCIHSDPPHVWDDMRRYINGGKMDGFPAISMSYYDETDLPFYYWLANTFALADRYFPSTPSGSTPNRMYALLGTSSGVMNNDDPGPSLTTPSILDALDKRGITWGAYSDREPFDGALPENWPGVAAHAHSYADFLAAAKNGTLPSVVWLDSIPNVEDEHPTADVQVGEAWTREVYEALAGGPEWSTTALLWTYDEGGGFFDHVPPPRTCPPDDGTLNQAQFFELGIRIPMAVVSPWARRHYVSHVVHEHTSMLRFIEAVFDLPALTARDANSDALLDMFDFACANTASIEPPPAAGKGGCH